MNKSQFKNMLLLTVLAFLCYGCSKKDRVSIIDVDPFIENIKNEVFASNYFSRNENVPLQTDSTCFIKSIDGLKLVDNYYYIMDKDMVKLYQFTSEGKFVREIGAKGRGPGEYIEIQDFVVNSKEQLIFILSISSGKIIKYNTKGEFIKEYPLDHYPLKVCLSHDTSGFYLFSPPLMLEKASANQFRHYSNDGKELRSFNHTNIKESVLHSSIPILYNQIFYFKGVLYYFDEFYQRLTLINRNLDEEYIDFCFNGKKFNSSNEGEVNGRVQTGTVMSAMIFGENMFIETLKDLHRGTIIYKTKTKEGFNVVFDYATIDNGLYNDLDGGYPVWPQGMFNDSTLFSTFSAQTYMLFCKNSEYLVNQKAKDIDNRLAFDRMIDTLGLMSNPVIQILHK
jgi:hypothetical protein